MEINDTNSLSHTRWNCKCHIVLAPKYRRKIFYKDKESSDRENTATVMWVERGKNYRGRGVSKLYPFACGDTAKDCSAAFCGVSELKGKSSAMPCCVSNSPSNLWAAPGSAPWTSQPVAEITAYGVPQDPHQPAADLQSTIQIEPGPHTHVF